MSPPSSESKNKSDIKQTFAFYLLNAYFLLDLFFDAGDECDRPSETSADFQQTIRHCMPEGITL
jgi:hypothetical protein